MYTLLTTDSNYFAKNEMISYPNLLTPPSSNEDSPGSINVSSPTFSPSYQFTMTDMILQDPYQPYLHIVEEPIDKFRFRYKSEMSGTHGSLSGMKSDRSRKQTYPTVELHNVTTPAIVRCSLYQYNCSNIEELRQPHAHRLIKKVGNDDQDDPHDIHVSPEDGFQASFHSMGIIHTAKKHIVKELLNKKKKLKIEENARREGMKRSLTQKEETELQLLAENESKSINLNIVCLRFDAFVENRGILHQICKPVYSHAINNLKSALTGELKIVRMDHCSSPCCGGREIYILVEKVTKKNIKVRFYELDDEENEIWHDYGKFNDLDVHHQYAIVFKTPAYRTQNLDQHKKVFIELERPSDGARSDAKDFVFTPNPNVSIGSKRPRTSYSSASSYNSYGNSSGELPTIVTNMPYTPNVETNLIEDIDLIMVSKLVNSDDFKEIWNKDPELWGMFNENMVTDSPIKKEVKIELPYITSDEFSPAERSCFANECKNLISFIKTRPPKDRIVGKLLSIFSKDLNNQGDKLLHMTIKGNVAYVANLIIKLSCYESDLLNTTNNSGRTALHQAVLCNNALFVQNLLAHNAYHSPKDVDGNTPLHLAVKRKCLFDIFKLLVNGNDMLDTENSEGETALQLAVCEGMLPVVELLCQNNIDINIIDKKDGRNILHKAIEMGSYEMVKYLLDKTPIDLTKEDFSGNSPLKMALALIDAEKPQQTVIYDYLKKCLISRNLPSEIDVKGEIESEEEIEEMDLDEHLIKLENLSPEELEEKYKDVTEIPKMYLEELVEILDKSGNWHSLAQLLDLEYLFNSSIVDDNDSPSKNLLSAALASGESILHIRNFLENLEETRAVSVLDKMIMNR